MFSIWQTDIKKCWKLLWVCSSWLLWCLLALIHYASGSGLGDSTSIWGRLTSIYRCCRDISHGLGSDLFDIYSRMFSQQRGLDHIIRHLDVDLLPQISGQSRTSHICYCQSQTSTSRRYFCNTECFNGILARRKWTIWAKFDRRQHIRISSDEPPSQRPGTWARTNQLTRTETSTLAKDVGESLTSAETQVESYPHHAYGERLDKSGVTFVFQNLVLLAMLTGHISMIQMPSFLVYLCLDISQPGISR